MANSQAKILPLLPQLRKVFKGILEGNTLLWKCQLHSGGNSLHTSLECGEAPSHRRLVPRPTSHRSRTEINLIYYSRENIKPYKIFRKLNNLTFSKKQNYRNNKMAEISRIRRGKTTQAPCGGGATQSRGLSGPMSCNAE